MKRVLFICHEATKTGAPLVLLYFIQWLKKNNPNWIIHVVVLKGGQLLSEFESVADKVFYVPSIKSGRLNRIKYLVERLTGNYQKNNAFESEYIAKMLVKLSSIKFDLIYANTIIAVPVAVEMKRLLGNGPKVITHLHEMNTIIRMSLPDFGNYIPDIDHFISVSSPVTKNLTTNWSIPHTQITLVYEFTRIEEHIEKNDSDSDYFICGASGVTHWRKGDDIFLQLAAYIKKKYPDAAIKFQWIGTILEQNIAVLEEDIKKLNLGKFVEFFGEVPAPFNYYNNFDLFLMVSREDPFPLVCIEAAMLEKPIICFDQATGTADVLLKGGGYIVPYLDIEAMAEKIMMYYQNSALKLSDGKRAKELFMEFTPEIKCPEIMNVIQNVLNSTVVHSGRSLTKTL